MTDSEDLAETNNANKVLIFDGVDMCELREPNEMAGIRKASLASASASSVEGMQFGSLGLS